MVADALLQEIAHVFGTWLHRVGILPAELYRQTAGPLVTYWSTESFAGHSKPEGFFIARIAIVSCVFAMQKVVYY